MKWRDMNEAPKDGSDLLVRRHNDIDYEYAVVWWNPYDKEYPWTTSCSGGFPEGRLDSFVTIKEILNEG